MITFLGTELKPIDDMLRQNAAGTAVCKACGKEQRALYMTNKGYFCKEHK